MCRTGGAEGARAPHLGQLMNDHGDEAGVNHCLHLLLVTCSDVGEEPHRLLQITNTHKVNG